MSTSEKPSETQARIEALISKASGDLLEAQEAAESGSIRDAYAEMRLRAKLFGLRSELAAIDEKYELAMKLAKSEKALSSEARQIVKSLIADELAELRAYVFEGSELEDNLEELPEKLFECDLDPSGSETESLLSSKSQSEDGSSTSR